MKIKTITQDCSACPSAWSGLTEDSKHWRIRYRWGWLRLAVDEDPNNLSVFSQIEPEILESHQIGDEYDGTIDFDEAISHFPELDFSEAEWEYNW